MTLAIMPASGSHKRYWRTRGPGWKKPKRERSQARSQIDFERYYATCRNVAQQIRDENARLRALGTKAAQAELAKRVVWAVEYLGMTPDRAEAEARYTLKARGLSL